MSTSTAERAVPRAIRATVSDDELVVDLADGRTLIAPLAWYPRLLHGTPSERKRWSLLGGGVGIHWPALDEDISVEGLLEGRPSGESQASFKRWLSGRRTPTAGKRPTGRRARRK